MARMLRPGSSSYVKCLPGFFYSLGAIGLLLTAARSLRFPPLEVGFQPPTPVATTSFLITFFDTVRGFRSLNHPRSLSWVELPNSLMHFQLLSAN
jgi:hypothetical protein